MLPSKRRRQRRRCREKRGLFSRHHLWETPPIRKPWPENHCILLSNNWFSVDEELHTNLPLLCMNKIGYGIARLERERNSKLKKNTVKRKIKMGVLNIFWIYLGVLSGNRPSNFFIPCLRVLLLSELMSKSIHNINDFSFFGYLWVNTLISKARQNAIGGWAVAEHGLGTKPAPRPTC